MPRPRRFDMKDFSGAPAGLKYSPDGTRLHGSKHLLSDYNGQPQPPIYTRLEQIKTVLTDDDIYRDPDFKTKLEECRKYTRDLKFGTRAGKHYNASFVINIELKISVHDKWIREKEKTAEIDFDDEIEYENPRSQGRLMPRWWEPEPEAVQEQLEDLGFRARRGGRQGSRR